MNIYTKIDGVDNIIINQFMGMGDILFCIPLSKYFKDLGYNIIWPINNEFLGIKKNFEFIEFVDKSEFNMDYNSNSIIIDGRSLILPLRFANNIINNGEPKTCMIDKYKFLNLPSEMWTTLEWKRDIKKENELYYDILKIKDDEEYNLINETFNMDKKIHIDCDNGLRNIKFDIIDGFGILDWYKVIENAINIHTVGTSIVFIIEVIPTKKLCDYFLYARRPFEPNCDYYNYLLKKPTKEI
jgi:hypothetical protein